MKPIDVAPHDFENVKAILIAHVPEFEVRAFGSRVVGTARVTSDLDLAVMTETPLALARMADLREAFSDSDLPFKVDIADWAATTENFRRIIDAEFVVIQEGSQR
ncbi:MAG: nucleotidyltransferase domain-containing protein [Candidatus Brocadiia bacterium]